ncbi:MAG: hypothetical protein ACPIOQ_84525, partial [Promethearchaeia archaeon]
PLAGERAGRERRALVGSPRVRATSRARGELARVARGEREARLRALEAARLDCAMLLAQIAERRDRGEVLRHLPRRPAPRI